MVPHLPPVGDRSEPEPLGKNLGHDLLAYYQKHLPSEDVPCFSSGQESLRKLFRKDRRAGESWLTHGWSRQSKLTSCACFAAHPHVQRTYRRASP